MMNTDKKSHFLETRIGERMKKIILLVLIIKLTILTGCSLMNNDSVNPLINQMSNGLPVFYLHPKPVSKDFYSPVTLIYKGTTYEAEGRIRGGGSAYYPKKSYTIRFSDNELFNDPDVGENGFENRKKLVLISNFDDNSYIRNRLSFWVWNQIGNWVDRIEAPAIIKSFEIDTFNSVVYLNGAYEGLYTVVEFITDDAEYDTENDGYIGRNGFLSGGNIFKATTYEGDLYMRSDLKDGFEKKSGLPVAGEEGAYTDLEEFITFINNSSDDDLTDLFKTHHLNFLLITTIEIY